MEFLGNDGVRVKDDKFEVKLKVIDKPRQMAYLDVAISKDDVSDFIKHIRLIDFILTECIDELKIDGKEVDPSYVASHANIMDSDTLDELRQLHELCSPSLEGLGQEDKKK